MAKWVRHKGTGSAGGLAKGWKVSSCLRASRHRACRQHQATGAMFAPSLTRCQCRYCGAPPFPSTFGTCILRGVARIALWCSHVLAQFVSSLQLFCRAHFRRWLWMPNREGYTPLNHPCPAETSTRRQLPPPAAQGRASARKKAEGHTAHSALFWFFLY